jgi:integrase
MRRDETESNRQEGAERDKKAGVQGHGKAARFEPVRDSRKRKVRGLVQRGGKYYAQMRITTPDGKSRAVRIPLEATRLDLAVAEAEKKRTEKRGGEIHLPGVRPSFSKLVEEYIKSNIGTRRTRGKGYLSKSDSTQRHESQSLQRWVEHLGGKRIDWIQEKDLVAFVNKRTRDGVKNRTINLDLIAFNNAMGYAKKLKLITTPPRLEKQTEEEAECKRLLTREEIKRLSELAAIPSTYTIDGVERKYHAKNGDQLALFIRMLAASGCREQEALKIKKEDVDIEGERLTIQGVNAKSGKSRTINFNSSLSEVLKEILEALNEVPTEWLFPSPIRGDKDRPVATLRQSFNMVREIAGMPDVGFHHFRHYFASHCVMMGIDFMTIAKWLGHQDGGILVGKVYGHLNQEHQLKAAKKLSL